MKTHYYWIIIFWNVFCLLTYLLNLLTPYNEVLLEKLTGLQLVKKLLAFYGTRRFITAFTSARHLSLSWASPIQSITPHTTSWRSILTLSSHLRLGFPNGLFPSGFLTKNLYTHLPPHPSYIPRLSHSSRLYHPHDIGWGVQINTLLIMKFFFHTPVTPVLFEPNILLNTLFSHLLSLHASFSISDQVSHP
jgi:hypothetical protein